MEEEVISAIKKCAVGFGASEVVEEFAVEDGQLKLKAVKLLIDESDPCSLSDAELEKERQNLLNILAKEND